MKSNRKEDTKLLVEVAARKPARPRAAAAQAKSDLMDSIHQMASGLHRIGALDQQTMRTFDATCLAPAKPLPPSRIVAIRRKAKMSQPVFALYLNTTKGTVAKWESGEKSPSGPARKLLEVIDKHGAEILA